MVIGWRFLEPSRKGFGAVEGEDGSQARARFAFVAEVDLGAGGLVVEREFRDPHRKELRQIVRQLLGRRSDRFAAAGGFTLAFFLALTNPTGLRSTSRR